MSARCSNQPVRRNLELPSLVFRRTLWEIDANDALTVNAQVAAVLDHEREQNPSSPGQPDLVSDPRLDGPWRPRGLFRGR
jgi:hypothetical protein